MAMVAAALRREGKRVVTVRPSILYDKCMHLPRINDESYTNQFNLNLQRTPPSTSTQRAHHNFTGALPNHNAYKKPSAGYFERRYTSAAIALGEEVNRAVEEEEKVKQGDDESSNRRQRAALGLKLVSFCTESSHSVINAEYAKASCFETKPTAPTTVTIKGKRYTCDTKYVLDWKMQNMMFSWTFLVVPSSECDIVLGVDWMKHVSPLTLKLGEMSLTIDMPDGMHWTS